MHLRRNRTAKAVVAGLLLALLAGCAGSNVSRGPVFFPQAPNLPRLQYLTGITTSIDVEGDPDTYSLFSYGKAAQKNSFSIVKPSAIANAAGKLYVADMSGQILIIDLPKKTMEPLKGNQNLGKLSKPVGIAVDQAGFVFVADAERKEVLIYDPQGEYLKSLGHELAMNPTDVAVLGNRLYVLDTRNAVIHVMDPTTSAFIQDIGKGSDPETSLSLPTKMSIDKQGIIRVSNAGRGTISSYDQDGHFLGSFGKLGDGLGQFSRPKGLTADPNGYVYVVDAGFQNVQVFNETGRLLTYFGSPKLPVGGMNLPCDVSISSDDLPFYQQFAKDDFELSQVVFVANQFGRPKISLYGYGKLKGIDYDQVYQRAAQEREKKARENLERRNKVTSQLAPQPAQSP